MNLNITKDQILGKVDSATSQQYIELVDNFIAKNMQNKDVLSVVLEYNQLLIQLSLLYNSSPGRFGSMPELDSKLEELINFKQNLNEELMNAAFSDYFAMSALSGDLENFKNISSNQDANYTLDAKVKGINAYMLAATRYCLENEDCAERLLDSLAKIDFLKDKGVDVNGKDEFGRTALFYVVIGPIMFGVPQHPGREQTVKKLLAAGANPKIKDVNGHTALDYFMLEHYPSIDSINLLCKSMGIAPITDIKPNLFVPEPKQSNSTRLKNIISYPFLAIYNLIQIIMKSFS